jgi:hypothetical protein
MFFGHPRAGRNFAGRYFLVGSAIANDIEPTEYLTDVLLRIRDATTDEQLDALLPDRWAPLSSEKVWGDRYHRLDLSHICGRSKRRGAHACACSAGSDGSSAGAG